MAGVAGKSGRKPGTPRTGGRVKGTPNKVTRELKDMILGALTNKGGVEYLERQADNNPVAFLGLIGRVLPLTVAGDKDNPLQTKITITWDTK